MKTRRQKNDSHRPNKRLKNSIDKSENSEPIPIDLVIEVLSRLPVKSLARTRCVSKPWASILLRPDFTELFLTRSSASPKLLVACQNKKGELLFFSSHQPQNPDENSSLVVANYHMKFQFDLSSSQLIRPVHGLICLKHLQRGRTETVLEICNPSTGFSLTSPKVKTRRISGSSFLGYDPIEKQFKLLSMTRKLSNPSVEHQVLTLGTGKLSWRMIQCSIRHYPLSSSICINGVLYYLAGRGGYGPDRGIICFDIKSEKFKFISVADGFRVELVNYKGKLATLKSDLGISFELAVLEDAEKHEWLNHTYALPTLWKDIVGDAKLSLVGVTKTGEIVFSPMDLSNGFYLIYYNLERSTIVKVATHGMEAACEDGIRVHAFLDHVQDVKLWW